jgi:hypothetical protein
LVSVARCSASSTLSLRSTPRGGLQRQSYDHALAEARETLANLEAAEAIGYLPSVDAGVRKRLNHIIGTLVKLVR